MTATPKGEATRRRILDAARREFAEHGIAGSRVDRIAEAARSNKAQLYQHFGSKDALFDAVYAENIEWMVNSVPLEQQPLADYAVALYDVYLEHPELVRLTTWSRLERHPTGDLYADGRDHNSHKVDAVRTAQEMGLVDASMDPVDILSLVTALSMTWSPASALIAADPNDSDAVHERRRAALRAAVMRAFS